MLEARATIMQVCCHTHTHLHTHTHRNIVRHISTFVIKETYNYTHILMQGKIGSQLCGETIARQLQRK